MVQIAFLRKPRYPEQHDPHNVAERGVVFWKHLDPQSYLVMKVGCVLTTTCQVRVVRFYCIKFDPTTSGEGGIFFFRTLSLLDELDGSYHC